MSDIPAVPAVDSTVDLSITDVSYGGRGVGRADGCVVFVPGVISGERVSARITGVRKRFCEAELVEVLEPAAAREKPACPLAGVCPGCSYQHVAYEEEVRIKQSQFADLLKRMGGVGGDICPPPFASPRPLGYRNKAVLHAGPLPEQVLGYMGHDNRTILDVPACPLLVDALNARLAERRADADFMAAVKARTSVTLRWTEADGALAWHDADRGAGMLTESTPLGPLDVPRRAFFQVNPWVANPLLEYVIGLIKDTAPLYLLDLYCGVGLFALAAGKAGVRHVLGIEWQRAAIRAALRNGRRLDLHGLEFVVDRVRNCITDALEHVVPASTMVVLDPPRKGVAKSVLESLVRARPQTLVYISCAADTLARDIALLKAGGYKVTRAQLFDMFPRTAHFESVTVLSHR